MDRLISIVSPNFRCASWDGAASTLFLTEIRKSALTCGRCRREGFVSNPSDQWRSAKLADETQMSGKFLKRNAIIDTIKNEEKMNSLQARTGKRHHVDTVPCGCPDDNCGAFHVVRIERPLPTPSEADETLRLRRRTAKKSVS